MELQNFLVLPFMLLVCFIHYKFNVIPHRQHKAALVAIAEKWHLHVVDDGYVTLSGVYQGTDVSFEFQPIRRRKFPHFIARINCSSSHRVTLAPGSMFAALGADGENIDRMFEVSVEPESPSSEFLKKTDVRQLLLTLENDLPHMTHLIIETGFIEYSRNYFQSKLSEEWFQVQVDFMVQLMRLAGGEAPEPITRTDEPQ